MEDAYLTINKAVAESVGDTVLGRRISLTAVIGPPAAIICWAAGQEATIITGIITAIFVRYGWAPDGGLHHHQWRTIPSVITVVG